MLLRIWDWDRHGLKGGEMDNRSGSQEGKGLEIAQIQAWMGNPRWTTRQASGLVTMEAPRSGAGVGVGMLRGAGESLT